MRLSSEKSYREYGKAFYCRGKSAYLIQYSSSSSVAVWFHLAALSAKESTSTSNVDILAGNAENKSKPSSPTKLNKLKYSGYSAEFLDRIEANGNIPHKQMSGQRETSCSFSALLHSIYVHTIVHKYVQQKLHFFLTSKFDFPHSLQKQAKKVGEKFRFSCWMENRTEKKLSFFSMERSIFSIYFQLVFLPAFPLQPKAITFLQLEGDFCCIKYLACFDDE